LRLVEPVEINAGAWYLRGVACDSGYAWDVCEPVTAEVVATVTLDPDTATMRSVGENGDAISIAEDAVRRFAAGALGITPHRGRRSRGPSQGADRRPRPRQPGS